MTEEQSEGGLYIDSDWKQEAATEKARLAGEEAKKKEEGVERAASGAANPELFLELVNMLAMQAVIGLGGYEGPGGERIPPNHEAAKHHIAMLDVLLDKTKGNLSDEEQQALERVLHELRMQFVAIVGGAGGVPGVPPEAGKPPQKM